MGCRKRTLSANCAEWRRPRPRIKSGDARRIVDAPIVQHQDAVARPVQKLELLAHLVEQRVIDRFAMQAMGAEIAVDAAKNVT